MARAIEKEGAALYQCEACGFHYRKRALAEQCEGWCREHKSCNLEIVKDALENQGNASI